MEAAEFEISRDELFCLAALYGLDSLVNIPYEEDDYEGDLEEMFKQIMEKLRNKNWLDEDFDGKMTVDPTIELAVMLCALPQRIWRIQIQSKKDVLSELAMDVYRGGENLLLLNHVDGKVFRVTLTQNQQDLISILDERMSLSQNEHAYQEIQTDSLTEIINTQPYTLLSISQYTVEAEEEEKILVCHDAAMILALEQSGNYLLNVEDSNKGLFKPVSAEECQKSIRSVIKEVEAE